MRKSRTRLLTIGISLVAVLAAVPALIWLSLTHEPSFYREMVSRPGAQREAKAKHFVSQSLQLRNDIHNEPEWEAIFTDQEVNAWLAEDLVTHFADQLPPQVHEPRVMFEMDRVTLAFELDKGPVRTVIWVVARPRVPDVNVLELTFEKIRAGVLPVPADQALDRITQHARARGLDVSWKHNDEGLPVATLRYTPNDRRDDVKLERLEIRKGEMRLAGKSDRQRGVVQSPTLPTRRVLQSKFPRRNVQPKEGASPPPPESVARSSTTPTS
jgi:hypothetical protein